MKRLLILAIGLLILWGCGPEPVPPAKPNLPDVLRELDEFRAHYGREAIFWVEERTVTGRLADIPETAVDPQVSTETTPLWQRVSDPSQLGPQKFYPLNGKIMFADQYEGATVFVAWRVD